MISREKNRGRREAGVSRENEMPTGQEWNASGWEPQAQSSLKRDWLFWAGGRARETQQCCWVLRGEKTTTREREANGACGAKTQQQKKHSGVLFPFIQEEDEGLWWWVSCVLGLEATIPGQQRSQLKPTQRQFSTHSYDWETVAIRHKPCQASKTETPLSLVGSTRGNLCSNTHTSRMESAVQASRWARQAQAEGGDTD